MTVESSPSILQSQLGGFKRESPWIYLGRGQRRTRSSLRLIWAARRKCKGCSKMLKKPCNRSWFVFSCTYGKVCYVKNYCRKISMNQVATRRRPLESRYFRTTFMLFKACRRCSSILPRLWNFQTWEPIVRM